MTMHNLVAHERVNQWHEECIGCTNACTMLRGWCCDKLAHRCCGIHRVAYGFLPRVRGAIATQERMQATIINEWGTHRIGHAT